MQSFDYEEWPKHHLLTHEHNLWQIYTNKHKYTCIRKWNEISLVLIPSPSSLLSACLIFVTPALPTLTTKIYTLAIRRNVSQQGLSSHIWVKNWHWITMRTSVPLLLFSSRLSQIDWIHNCRGDIEAYEEATDQMDGCGKKGRHVILSWMYCCSYNHQNLSGEPILMTKASEHNLLGCHVTTLSKVCSWQESTQQQQQTIHMTGLDVCMTRDAVCV